MVGDFRQPFLKVLQKTFISSIVKNVLKAFFGVREAIVDPEEELLARNVSNSSKELNK